MPLMSRSLSLKSLPFLLFILTSPFSPSLLGHPNDIPRRQAPCSEFVKRSDVRKPLVKVAHRPTLFSSAEVYLRETLGLQLIETDKIRGDFEKLTSEPTLDFAAINPENTILTLYRYRDSKPSTDGIERGIRQLFLKAITISRNLPKEMRSPRLQLALMFPAIYQRSYLDRTRSSPSFPLSLSTFDELIPYGYPYFESPHRIDLRPDHLLVSVSPRDEEIRYKGTSLVPNVRTLSKAPSHRIDVLFVPTQSRKK